MHGKVHLTSPVNSCSVVWSRTLPLPMHWDPALLSLQNPKIWCLSSWEVTRSGSRLGRGIPKASVWVVSWTGCGVEVCHEKLLPFLDILEHTLCCTRLLRSARGR